MQALTQKETTEGGPWAWLVRGAQVAQVAQVGEALPGPGPAWLLPCFSEGMLAQRGVTWGVLIARHLVSLSNLKMTENKIHSGCCNLSHQI